MASTEIRITSPSNASATNLSQRDSAVEEITQGDIEAGLINTHGQPNLSKASKVTPNNILSMQRTIGNQAVQRLLKQQKAIGSAAPTGISRLLQANNQAHSNHLNSTATSQPALLSGPLQGVNSIQRLPDKKTLLSVANLYGKGKKYEEVLNNLEIYNFMLTGGALEGNQPERAAKASHLDSYLVNNISIPVTEYIKEIAGKQDYAFTHKRFTHLLTEITLERENIQKIVTNASYNKNNTNNQNTATPVFTWKKALDSIQDIGVEGKDRNARIVGIADRIGMPLSYVKILDNDSLQFISDADQALVTGDLDKGYAALSRLKELPSYGFIKSTLERRHIAQINPQLAKALNKDQPFKQNDKKMGQIGFDQTLGDLTGDTEYKKNLRNYNTEGNYKEGNQKDQQDILGGAKGFGLDQENLAGRDKYVKDFYNRKKWEKKKVKLDKFEGLNKEEKSALVAYTTDYKMFNEPLRADLRHGEEADNTPKKGGKDAKYPAENKFTEKHEAQTQNLVSALNSLPAYKGYVYRHDKIFAGFKEINEVGGVTTDMALLSTSREANTLRKIHGSPDPDVLVVIKSKTGRFIKPVSTFNTASDQDENEVLFKPGVSFKVVNRIERNADNAWPAIGDSELKEAFEQDSLKNDMKMIIKKEEV